MKTLKFFVVVTTLITFSFGKLKAQQTWTYSPSGTTQPYMFSTYSSGNTPQIGIGAFNTTTPTLPSADLHILTTNPSLKFQTTGAMAGSAGITWSAGGNYSITTTWFPSQGTDRLHVGSTRFGQHISGNNIVFGNDLFGPGINTLGTFTFNGQIGAPSIAITPTLSGPTLWQVPSGNLLGVNGNSYIGGKITMGSSTTYGGSAFVYGNGDWGYNIASLSNNTTNPTKLFVGVDVSANKEVFYVSSNGQVKIGYRAPSSTCTHADFKLSVDGKLVANTVYTLATDDVCWADFVFDKGYKLTPLKTLEDYINKNHHLPEIPTTAEITENGINLGEMNARLLQKVEELTLYIIEMNKENENMKKALEEQNNKIESLRLSK